MTTEAWSVSMRSYTDRVWSDEARAELQAKIEHLTEDDLRRLLLRVTSEANPDCLISTLRGAAFGLAALRGAAPALEPTADATRVAEMTRRMSDLERERDQLRAACEGLITAMIQLGKEHHREVAFAQDVMGQAAHPAPEPPSEG